jgi:integrase
MAKAKLTKGAVERFQARAGVEQDVLWDTEVKGFGIRLSVRSNVRAYFLQFRVKGTNKQRIITIGRHADPWTCELARARALELKVQMLGDGISGVDPVAEAKRKEAERIEHERLQVAQSTTLKQVLDSYLANRKLRPRTAQDYRRHCEKNLAAYLNKPVAQFTRNDALAVFTEMSARAPVQANACMSYLRALLHHAREMHATDDGQFPVLAVNPVSRLWKLTEPNEESARETRIPLPKIGACWNWLRKRSADARTETDRTTADFVSCVLLTGCRRNEMGALFWTDIDFEAKTLTLRAEITKTKRKLVLPMSTVLHDLLLARKHAPPLDERVARRRRVQRASEYVFPSNGRKTPYIVQAQAVMEALTKIADCDRDGERLHIHALRRTFDDVGMECRIDGDVRRILLNHVGHDVHSTAYSNNRAFLAAAVEQVAQWVVNQAVVAERVASGTNVVPFPQRA